MSQSCGSQQVIEEPVYFWFFGGNPAGGGDCFTFRLLPNLHQSSAVTDSISNHPNRHKQISQYFNISFNEALSSVNNMPDMFNDVLHRILSLFLSSIAIVGVDFCLVCLIDKSIQKYFVLPSLFFA